MSPPERCWAAGWHSQQSGWLTRVVSLLVGRGPTLRKGAVGLRTGSSLSVPRNDPKQEVGMAQNRPSGAAVGWTVFAAVMMFLLGIWWAIAGLAGILKDDIFVVGEKYVFKFNVQTWGWIHLLLGIVVFIAGFA